MVATSQSRTPAVSVHKLQGRVLAELKVFNPATGLKHVDTVRGEAWGRLQLDPERAAQAAALAALAAARARAKADCLPCRVGEGLYIGGAGAARNLKGLRKRGITHIVNASPSVPCHFKDNPEGSFEYLALPLFDDPDADLAPHIEASNAFIAAARARGGAVLVHCYAGQSRSAALVIAHLLAARPGLGLMDAWALVRAARPCAQPNPGFLRQLAAYAKALAAPAAGEPSEEEAAAAAAADADAAAAGKAASKLEPAAAAAMAAAQLELLALSQ